MTHPSIHAITMPKWGLAMEEGKIAEWLIAVGDEVREGTEIATVETSKITGPVESHGSGILRRIVSEVGEVLPIGALMAVLADSAVSDDDIETFVGQFQETYVPPAPSDAGTENQRSVIEIDGKTIAYLATTEANGEAAIPVVLIHGFGGDTTSWLLNLSVIAEARPVYALDMPGHGASAKTVADPTPHGLANTVASFLDALQIDRAHIVGHSLGGAVALTLAKNHPEKVASLSLLAPCGLGDTINIEFVQGYIDAGRRKEMKPILKMLFADSSAVTRDMIDEVLKYKRIDGVVQALTLVAAGFTSEGQQSVHLRSVLEDSALPTQVIWGAQDKIVDPAHSAGLPDTVEVHLLENAGHMPQMEAARTVNDLLSAHFSSSEAKGSATLNSKSAN